MKKQRLYLLSFLIILLALNSVLFIFMLAENKESVTINNDYGPIINPADFTTQITNPYFNMPIGKKMVYEAKTEEGTEKTEILITGWAKEIMNVETLVFWDRVYLNGTLIEDTRDYIAQDSEGNVWYFGENVDNYIDGVLTDHQGSWISGINGALPGIWMKAVPEVGDEYRQEYYKGEAEDIGRVDALGVSVTTPLGTFTDCVKIFEWTPLESVTAYKHYCSDAGGAVLEKEDNERVELIEIDFDGAKCIKLPSKYSQEGVSDLMQNCALEELIDYQLETSEKLKTEITIQDAKEIALQEVSGEVTDIAVEKKFGKLAYVVEIKTNNREIDVIIDINSGEVLGIEE